jgi:hypothetical protein
MRLSKRLKRLYRRLPWNFAGRISYIISFPKCGRTWLRLMIGHYLVHHFQLPTENYLRIQNFRGLDRRVPEMEVYHDDKPYKRSSDELGRNKNHYRRDKIIFLVRDPRDIVISWYYAKKYRESGAKYLSTIHDFIREEYGSLETIVRYFNIWWAERHKPDGFLLIRYEDLHSAPKQELRRVLAFLGLTQIDDELVAAAVSFASFDHMRELEVQGSFDMRTLRPEIKGDERSYKTRKGIVGDHLNIMSEADLTYVDNYLATHLDPEFGYST